MERGEEMREENIFESQVRAQKHKHLTGLKKNVYQHKISGSKKKSGREGGKDSRGTLVKEEGDDERDPK